MNEHQQILEVVDARGELGFLDLAAKPAGLATSNSNLLAVQLGDGNQIFVSSDQLTEVQPGKYRFVGSFGDLRRQEAAQIPPHTSANQQTLTASVRYEGKTMIVPVLEEVIVTQKRLMLREEIRLTKSREEISNP